MFQKLNDEQLEYRANLLRENFGIRRGEVIDVRHFWSQYRAKHPELNLLVVDDDELPGKEAETIPSLNTIRIRRSVYLEFLQGTPRAELTVLEELAHVIFKHTGTRNRTVTQRDATVSPRSRQSYEEWEAKYFAIALKAPLSDCAECSSAQQIQDRFRLSEQAAIIRWKEVERYLRRKAGVEREIPPEIWAELNANRKKWLRNDVRPTPTSRQHEQLAESLGARIQRLASHRCTKCGGQTLVFSGGCWTCQKCGESNCN